MVKIYQNPPISAALIITIYQSVHLMSRPDSIWIPIIVEIPIFVISYILFAIVNRLVVAPLSRILASRTSSLTSGFVFSLLIAAIGSGILFLADFFNKSTIFHSAYLLGAFLPLLVMSFFSFYYAARLLVADN